jgi:hypothetical protein
MTVDMCVLFRNKKERHKFSRVVTDSFLPHHGLEPRELPRKLRIVVACDFGTFWASLPSTLLSPSFTVTLPIPHHITNNHVRLKKEAGSCHH